MARDSRISKEVYRKHIKLYRVLNNGWIFADLILPDLKKHADVYENRSSDAKRRYVVPKKGKNAVSRRRDADIAQIFKAQYQRGIFETNTITTISRIEAFIQECMVVAILEYPGKLSVISDKSGIPIDLFLEHENREDLLARYVALRCQGLMFGKPAEYLEKACKVLSIELEQNMIGDYLEIKASRDIIVHGSGEINRLYVEKAGDKRRGEVGDELVVDKKYSKHVLVTAKALSGAIQREVERVYG